MSFRHILLMLLSVCGSTYGQVLFDASLGTPPPDQGWAFLSQPFLSHSVAEFNLPSGTRLDTTNPITDRGGYFARDPIFAKFDHPNAPTLDRTAGFSLVFHLQVFEESHAAGMAGDDNGDGIADRAGFSVIALSDDLYGLELSFWKDRIWIQNDDLNGELEMFTQAEAVAFDTASKSNAFELRVFGDAYQLFAEENMAPILSGRLRNYVNFSGAIDPYEIPNFLFFGDNTSRGEADVSISFIRAGELPPACNEIDSLVASIAHSEQDLSRDINGDGTVDFSDVEQWLETTGDFLVGRTFRPGDANLDGNVDVRDFNIWNDHRASGTTSWCRGDFNADGTTDDGDFEIWRANRFQPTPAGADPVPEPQNGILAAVCLLTLLSRSRFLKPLSSVTR